MSEGLGVSIRRNVVTAVVAALIASGGLAGCSDGEADEPPDSGLPSKTELSETTPTSPGTETTPTEPSGPTPPELPEAAKRDNKAGAQAFVAYYLELLTYAAHTGDGDPIRRISTKGCVGCQDDARTAEHVYAGGGWERGGAATVQSVRGTAPSRPEDIYVGVTVHVAKAIYKASAKEKAQKLPASRYDLDFYLNRVDGGWKVARLERPS